MAHQQYIHFMPLPEQRRQSQEMMTCCVTQGSSGRRPAYEGLMQGLHEQGEKRA
jgi:hypothetical protein